MEAMKNESRVVYVETNDAIDKILEKRDYIIGGKKVKVFFDSDEMYYILTLSDREKKSVPFGIFIRRNFQVSLFRRAFRTELRFKETLLHELAHALLASSELSVENSPQHKEEDCVDFCRVFSGFIMYNNLSWLREIDSSINPLDRLKFKRSMVNLLSSLTTRHMSDEQRNRIPYIGLVLYNFLIENDLQDFNAEGIYKRKVNYNAETNSLDCELRTFHPDPNYDNSQILNKVD